MIFFIKQSEECFKKMTFENFKEMVLETVREKNHLTLVDDWEKHIIHKDFMECYHLGTTYYANIFFAEEIMITRPYIIIYQFTYHDYNGDSANFICLEGTFDKEVIEVFSHFSDCYKNNKARFFSCTLDDFHKEPKRRF